MKLLAFAALISAAMASQGSLAHSPTKQSSASTASTDSGKLSTPFGRPGDPKSASRTVTVQMSDTMRFSPDSLNVNRGETIRFVVKNDGKLLHEMVLGSEKSLEEHAALMRKFPEMEHDEPYMVHVEPSKTGEIVWTFDKSGQISFACLIPGHFEAGMTGKVITK
jgi:uncharacterized cupredoxin-like copper-binding protein